MKPFSRLRVVGVSLALAAACGGDDESSTEAETTAPPATTRIRIVHASPDAPNVDVWTASGIELAQDLAYGEASLYASVAAGEEAILFRVAPSSANAPIVFSSGVLTLQSGSVVTAIAAGLFEASDPEQALRLLPLVEGFGPEVAGKARARFVNASPNAPTLGVDLGNDAPASPEVASVPRYGDTGEAGILVDATTSLQIGLTVAGAPLTAFTTPDLVSGADAFVVVTGRVGAHASDPTSLSLLPVVQGGATPLVAQNPRLHFLQASPDAPGLDVFLGSTELVDDLAFGALAPVQLPPGGYSLDVFEHTPGAARPDTAPIAITPTGGLSGGQAFLAILTGFVTPGRPAPFQMQRYVDAFDTGDTRVRFVEASPDAPPIDIGVVSGTSLDPILVSNLSFLESTPASGLAVTPATYPIGVTSSSDPAEIVGSTTVVVGAGSQTFFVAAGAFSPMGGERPLRLIAIDTTITPWTEAAAPLE